MMSHLWQQEQEPSIDGIMDSFASDNGFGFDGSMSVGTTTPSFSAASSVYDPTGPFTPRSGRSTPHDHGSSSTLDFDSSFSSHGGSFSFDHGSTPDKGYFHKAEKVEMPMQYAQSAISLTPSRRQSSGYGMEHLDYNTMLQVTLNNQCVPGMSSPHHHNGGSSSHHHNHHHSHHHHHHQAAEQYSLAQDLSSSPFVMPTPHRGALPPHHSNSTPSNVQSIWSCSSESPIMMFGSESTPSTSPLQSMSAVKRESTHSSPSSPLRCSPPGSASAAAAAAAYRATHDPRRKLFAEAQRKTLALQKNQNDMEALRQLRSIQVNQDGSVLDCGSVKVRHVAPRRERCTYPECTKTFKRKEHLKRHFKATHEKEVELYTCPATNCNHVFKERRDNFVSHLLLHKQGKSSRTPYNEKAAKLYDEMCLQSKSRKRVKTGSTSSSSSSSGKN